jgi:hypothetical protein
LAEKLRRNGKKGIRLCKEDFIRETFDSVARIRLVKTEEGVTVNCKVWE